jgi:oxaloacetate decarboxylase gamma subunit
MSELMHQGLEISLLGMGTVFFFLTLLVFATITMSALVSPAEPSRILDKFPVVDTNQPEPAIKAAIVAAIHQFREDNKGSGKL